MKSYSLHEISDVINGTLTGTDKDINDVSIDSRTIGNHAGVLFFCLVGQNNDGHNYIPELINKGVKSFVVNTGMEFNMVNDCSFLTVDNTLDALQKFAAYHRNQFQIPVVAITGSNGKTTVKEWLAHILSSQFVVTRNPKSYNSQVGVPLSVSLIDSNADVAVFEAGISMTNEMEKLEKILLPHMGIFTNIGDAHQENFDSREQKISEKLQLFRYCKKLIYCSDHQEIDNQIKQIGVSTTEYISWGNKPGSKVEISYDEYKTGNVLHVKYNNRQLNFNLPFSDSASKENLTHVIIAGLNMGLTENDINEALKTVQPVEMRMELREGVNNCVLINDTYNADTGSLKVALDLLNQQECRNRRIIILSDILQTGITYSELVKTLNILFSRVSIDMLIFIGEQFYSYQNEIEGNTRFFRNTDEFLSQISSFEFKNDVILIKGARIFALERIVQQLEYRHNRTRLEVNLDAITHNYNVYRSKLDRKTKIMVMVKALAYGSGSTEVARILQYNGVDYLGVAFIDEGVELRKAGVTVPIMVLNPEKQAFAKMVQFKLEPECYSVAFLSEIIQFLEKESINQFPVHIKIETGMHRQGVMESEIPKLLSVIKNSPAVIIKSVFSHLAASDEPEHDRFTLEQITKFEHLSQIIQSEVPIKILRHILNSAGIERFTNFQFDMVRLGIGLYGIGVGSNTNLQNVSSLYSFISQIKEVPAGGTIGYGRRGKAERLTRIGIVPIGYADGLDRRLSNGKGWVYIRGNMVPIIGTICMDMCMVNLTGLDVMVGDEVEIFGDHIRVSDIANKLDTIPYEIFTRVSERVKRTYFKT